MIFKKLGLAVSLIAASMTAHGADLLKAEQLLNAGQANAALIEVEALLANDATNPDGRFVQGIALARLNRRDEAIAVFRDLTEDFRQIPEPYNNLAVLLAQTGDYAGARDALETAVQHHPNYTVAWENLADIYSVMASLAYETVLQQNPENDLAKARLAALNLATQPVTESSPPKSNVEPSLAELTPTTETKPRPEKAPELKPTTTAEPTLPVATTDNQDSVEAVEEPQPESRRGSTIESVAMNPAQQAVMATVTQWATAWSQQNIVDYLASYSANYEPQDGQSRADWEAKRRQRLSKPSSITLQLRSPNVTLLDDDLATVKFIQDYRSENYQDTVRKTLLMGRENGAWRIVREQSIR